MDNYNKHNVDQAELAYSYALERVSSLSVYKDLETKKRLLQKVAGELSEITNRGSSPLFIKACSLQGIIEVELASLEKSQSEKKTWLKSGTDLLARANQELSMSLPGMAVSLLPDNLMGLATAIQLVSVQDRGPVISHYIKGFEYYIQSMVRLFFMREKALSILFQAEVFLEAEKLIKSKDTSVKILVEVAKLIDQATQRFAVIYDFEGLQKSHTIMESLEKRLINVSGIENPEQSPLSNDVEGKIYETILHTKELDTLVVSKKFCCYCGHKLMSTANFCSQCGGKIR